jgi:transposase-like protein/IS1 family transposase
MVMTPTTVFCPNPVCPARGQTGQGNIGIHSRQEKRFICTQCRQTFTATKGTAFYRLRTSAETVTRVVPLMAHGCPLQAMVVAFGVDERTVADWLRRAGVQGRAVQDHVVERPRALGQVQADESRVKKQGGVVWMALAMMVSTRLWLAGEVSAQRDMPLIRRLIERVRRCALHRPLLFCTDGLCSYVRAIRETFREPVHTGGPGRPQWRAWRNVCMAQVVQRYVQRRVVTVERRIVDGTPARVETLRRRSQGAGVINTAYIERLHATFRERLASRTRRGRALARQTSTLRHGMSLIGAVYNFCPPHESLQMAKPAAGGAWVARTPAMATGITEHGWSVRELLSFHVPPPRWAPPKRRGRPSHALKRLIERWCGDHG